MFNFFQKIVLVIGVCLSPCAFAQENIKTQSIDEVVVTANKTDQKISQTGKVLTVLTDSILQKYQSQTVGELLTRQTGFMIVGSQNTLGTNQDVYLRGASVGNTLILIDGMPMYDPSGISSNFDLNLITVGECERIEVLKGAQSTLYGSDAVAGVINIFTKKGKSNKPVAGTVSLNGGTFGTFRATAGLNGSFSKGYYNVQYTRLQSKGFSAAFDKAGNKGFDDDGIQQNNVLANVGLYLSKNTTLKLRTVLNNYQTDIDAGAFADEKDFTVKNNFSMLALGLEHRYQKGKLTFNYGFSKTERTFTDDSTSVEKGAFSKYSKTFYGGATHYAEVFNSLKINNILELVAGADLRIANTDQTYVSISQFGKYTAPPIGADTSKTSIFSVYASGLLKTQFGLFVELGGRYNVHSIYGSNFTYSFNPSYLLNERVKLFANLSTGFKAPSLYQLFSPYGNKKLNPETSVSTEAGVQVFSKDRKSNVRALYFDRNITNVIFFESLSNPPYGRYINFDKQHDNGWEIEGNVQFGQVNVWANVTLLDGKTTTQVSKRDTTFNNLFRRPASIFNIGFGYQMSEQIYVSTSVRNIGKRTDRFYNSSTFKTENIELEAYTTWDFYMEYRVSKNVKGYLDLHNLTDKQYFDVYGYNTKRFNFMIGVSVEF
ncbi:MAG: TonB-dependent receptor [Arcicella sp.]|nr:TonB-dependent receptor [Arcicella sp.]